MGVSLLCVNMLRFWLFFSFLFSFTAPLFSLERALDAGWNLVSVPVHSDTEVSGYLDQNLNGTVVKIWTYDGGWKKYEPDGSSNGLTQFQKNRGYWFLMDANGGTLSLDSLVQANALEINLPGWALVSFNQTSSLSYSDEVLGAENIDVNHQVENIQKVWGFGNKAWKSYSPGSLSGTLSNVEPGFAYWFLIQDSETSVVSPGSPLLITPTGSSAEAALVIGGATTLLPPTESQISGSRSRISLSRFSTQSSASTNVLSDATCNDLSDIGKIIGRAHAFSLNGRILND
ncbi:hypothetical protein HOF92_16365 [bacterium]|nr:hypothetical protein [bacterium]